MFFVQLLSTDSTSLPSDDSCPRNTTFTSVFLVYLTCVAGTALCLEIIVPATQTLLTNDWPRVCSLVEYQYPVYMDEINLNSVRIKDSFIYSAITVNK